MRSGSPGFNGARLRQAMDARGVSAASLAELIGVTRQAISQYINNAVTPHPEVLVRISQALAFPLTFFRMPLREGDVEPVLFRSVSATRKSARQKADARHELLLEIVDFLRDYVELPDANFPEFDVPVDPRQLSPEMVERLAVQTRRHWEMGDGPIPHLVRLIERNGGIVCRWDMDDETLDALCRWSEATPYFVLGTDKGSAVRSRYDCAHELGHLLLHRRVSSATLTRTQDHSLMEKQVNRFASALLLPAASFARDCISTTLDGFLALKPKWGVSVAAMIHRAQDLQLLGASQATALWKARTRRHWREWEPLDDSLPAEEPSLLRRAIDLIVREAGKSPNDISAELAISVADLESLIGLPPGYLQDPGPTLRRHDNVIPLPTGRSRA